MLVADMLRALVLLPLLVVTAADQVWLIYVVAFAESSLGQFFNPAKGALLPHLVGEQQILAANSLLSLSGQITGLIGPALGGALFALLGFRSLVLVDVGSYVVSAGAILLIVVRPAVPGEAENRSEALSMIRMVWRDLLAGVRIIQRERWLTAIFAVTATVMIAQGIINVLTVPYITQVLRGNAQTLAWLATSQSVGGLLGGALVHRIGRYLAPGSRIALSACGLGFTNISFRCFLPRLKAVGGSTQLQRI